MGRNAKDFLKDQMDFLESILQKDKDFLEEERQEGWDINYYDGLLPHPLSYGIEREISLEAFKKLVELGANIHNQCILSGLMPIHHAAIKGRMDILQFLFEKDANLKAEDHINKRTPLHYAVENGHVEVAKFLCKQGADPKMMDIDGYTPLHMAVEMEHLELIEVLVHSGTPINIQNKFTYQTPLHLATQKANKELMLAMLKLGANPNIPDIYGTTAIEIARNYDNFIFSKIMEKFEGKVSQGGEVKEIQTDSDKQAVS